jgi:VanZ family protein
MKKSARLLGWLLLTALVFVTICPNGLRPLSGEPVWFERSAAFAVFALMFSVGHPRQRLLVLVLTVAAAGALEAAQMLQSSRHTRLSDFSVKAAGCGFGWLLAYVATGLANARQRSRFGRSRA